MEEAVVAAAAVVGVAAGPAEVAAGLAAVVVLQVVVVHGFVMEGPAAVAESSEAMTAHFVLNQLLWLEKPDCDVIDFGTATLPELCLCSDTPVSSG